MISDGSILGIVPKTHLPNYSEFYELRHFTSGEGLEEDLWFGEEFGYVNVAVNQLFKCKEIPELVVACEICEDLWVPQPPSITQQQKNLIEEALYQISQQDC